MAKNKDEKDLEGDEEKTGGSKKMLIIIIAVAVLLVGGGVAAFFLLSGDEDVAEGENAGQSESAGEPEEAVVQGPAIYHEMDPKFVVNLTPGGRAKMLQASIKILTHDPETAEMLEKHSPMLRHHVFNLFSAQDSNGLFERKGREKLQAEIKTELEAKLQPHHKKAMINGVFFTEFVLQ